MISNSLEKECGPFPVLLAGKEAYARPARSMILQPFLIDAPGAHGVLEAHAPRDLDAVVTQVELQARDSQAGLPLDDRDVVADLGEPKGEGVAGDSGAADENFELWHG